VISTAMESVIAVNTLLGLGLRIPIRSCALNWSPIGRVHPQSFGGRAFREWVTGWIVLKIWAVHGCRSQTSNQARAEKLGRPSFPPGSSGFRPNE